MKERVFALGRWYQHGEHIPLTLDGFNLAETHEDQGRVWATFIRPHLQEWLKRQP